MSPSRVHEQRDIEANVAYWAEHADGSMPTEEEGMKIMHGLSECDWRKMTFHDIRGMETEYTLDRNGFQFFQLPETPAYYENEEEVKSKEYPAVAAKIKEFTGAKNVFVFNRLLRGVENQYDRYDPEVKKTLQPAKRPHTDYDALTAPEFFSSIASSPSPQLPVDPRFAALAEYIKSGKRWQILGWWRPLETVRRDPFALLDSASVPDSDFVFVPRDYQGRKGGNSILKYGGGGHRWCYLHEQGPDEVVVFKQFDSMRGEGHSWRCGHASFKVEGTEGLEPRRSVEMRAFVFYE